MEPAFIPLSENIDREEIMPISPVSSLNAINSGGPLVSGTQSVAPASNARIRPQASQAGAENKASVFVNQRAGEIRLSFPSDRADEFENGLKSLEETVRSENIALNISRDQDTGTIVVKFVDQTSGETVRQIPDEAMLRLSAMLGKLQGQLFDRKA